MGHEEISILNEIRREIKNLKSEIKELSDKINNGMELDPYQVADMISQICAEYSECAGCPYHDVETDECILERRPDDWEFEDYGEVISG